MGELDFEYEPILSDLVSVRCLDIGRVVITKDNSRRQDDLTVDQVRHKPYFPIP